MALGDLARPTNHHDWHQRRIVFCEDFLTRYHNNEEPILQNMRRAWAESLWHVGAAQRADDLFKGWLAESPRWSWGWIGWADCYRFGPSDHRDLNRAEQILQQGLGVEGSEDRDVFYERLEDVYEKQGRTDKLAQLKALAGPKPSAAPVSVKREGPKIGRNDPCSCGSGKKYKNCCGR